MLSSKPRLEQDVDCQNAKANALLYCKLSNKAKVVAEVERDMRLQKSSIYTYARQQSRLHVLQNALMRQILDPELLSN